MAPYTVFKERNVANVATDRVLKLLPIETGIMNVRRKTVFDAGNGAELHAIQDAGLWYLKYKKPDGTGTGHLPEQLKQRWTNFNQLRKFLDAYFATRNIKIEEVIA